jgi:hypothetical protein
MKTFGFTNTKSATLFAKRISRRGRFALVKGCTVTVFA